MNELHVATFFFCCRGVESAPGGGEGRLPAAEQYPLVHVVGTHQLLEVVGAPATVLSGQRVTLRYQLLSSARGAGAHHGPPSGLMCHGVDQVVLPLAGRPPVRRWSIRNGRGGNQCQAKAGMQGPKESPQCISLGMGFFFFVFPEVDLFLPVNGHFFGQFSCVFFSRKNMQTTLNLNGDGDFFLKCSRTALVHAGCCQ